MRDSDCLPAAPSAGNPNGPEVYGEARQRERDVILPDGTTHAGRTSAHWRGVALIVARMTRKRVGVDTASRMAADAELSPDQESVDLKAAGSFLAA